MNTTVTSNNMYCMHTQRWKVHCMYLRAYCKVKTSLHHVISGVHYYNNDNTWSSFIISHYILFAWKQCIKKCQPLNHGTITKFWNSLSVNQYRLMHAIITFLIKRIGWTNGCVLYKSGMVNFIHFIAQLNMHNWANF